MDASSRLRILVLGYVVRGPIAGHTWPMLQFTLGLARLGHEVRFLEDSEDYPLCYDPLRDEIGVDPSCGLEYAAGVFGRAGLGDRWAYHDAHRGEWRGPGAARALEWCAGADLLINVSGLNPIRPWLERVPRRIYVDLDPAFDQVRQSGDPVWRARARGHDAFFTVGENIAAGTARVPDLGITWQAVRQPIVLDLWPVTPVPAGARFTTLLQWDSYATREWEGMRLGMKSESFPEFFELPSRSRVAFDLALVAPDAARDRLLRHGWGIVDPGPISRDPWTYQRFIQSSRGEWTVAKHGYVRSRCGWFSERSAQYLASGRPVITQETGFSNHLPTGDGLFAFSTMDEALAALEEVARREEHHRRAARELAVEHFDSDRVLAGMLERALGSRGAT